MLPLTHTTGVVKQSTRRIVRVDPPHVPRLLAQNVPAAEAVEENLACCFARAVGVTQCVHVRNWLGRVAPDRAEHELRRSPTLAFPTYCVGLPICLPLPTWDVKPPTLLPLLGPTVLPLTHTTGMVEQSTRRIMRVDPLRVPCLLAQNVPVVEAVVENLACHFVHVVLAPWERLNACTYETGSDVLSPTMLSTSRGAVVLDEKDMGEGTPAVTHRPWKDEIGVLVDPKLRVYGRDGSRCYLGGDCVQSRDGDGQQFPSLLPSVPPR
ncbi:hypothetical protein EDB83DRAFT_2514296 [Lactarius deliciosus]|nr:hypothetical protein EDB83DRAFT_2514296 [Lactarius deliciosus]